MKRWWPVLSLLVILTMLLGACAVPAAPAAPQVVKETVVVEVEKSRSSGPRSSKVIEA